MKFLQILTLLVVLFILQKLKGYFTLVWLLQFHTLNHYYNEKYESAKPSVHTADQANNARSLAPPRGVMMYTPQSVVAATRAS